MRTAVILLAAGSGSRFGSTLPKQYVEACGRPLILHTLDHLAAAQQIQAVQPVIAEGDNHFAAITAPLSWPFTLLPPVVGGAARSISMQRGLAALPDHYDLIAVHDAARPLPSPALLADVITTAERFGAAVPGIAVHDTIKRIDADGKVIDTPPRAMLRAVQTPQAARRDWFEQALEREHSRLHLHSDDASLLEAAGFAVHISSGDARNRKITTPEDLQWLESELHSA